MAQTNSVLSSEYPRVAGRYVIFEPFTRGGMASVHLGRLLGPAGFSRTVAIKRMHEEFAQNPEFVAMFLDEARLVARINHPNVVPTLDVVALKAELLLVMEYICGESLMGLITKCREAARPPPIAVAVDCAIGMLNGLHAAHEAKRADGRFLSLVHRDVTPHNVLIGLDGIARVVDFGIAKATGTAHRTRVGEIKGKLSYLAPEQLQGTEVSRASDIYSASLVLWEALTCERLFKGDNEGAIIHSILEHRVKPPSLLRREIPRSLDAILLRGLDADPNKRWETAKQMAEALENAVSPVARSTVASWVLETAQTALVERQENLAYVESYSLPGVFPSVPPPPISNQLFRAGLAAAPETSGAFGLNDFVSEPKLVQLAHKRWRIGWLAGGLSAALLTAVLVLVGMRGSRRSQAMPVASAAIAVAVLATRGIETFPPASSSANPARAPSQTADAAPTATESASTPTKPQRKHANAATQVRGSARLADPLYRRD
jgi:eukaryotic-like serine/threonine-protein kinase